VPREILGHPVPREYKYGHLDHCSRVHRPLKIIAFNANGIGRQRYDLNKQLQDSNIDVDLFSETYLKPHERFFITNYYVRRMGQYPGRKCGTAVAVR
jgi:hypothetical protein